VLRASRRLLRRGGRTAFFTIHPAPGLPEPLYRRALRAGPSATATRRRSPADLLHAAGFTQILVEDVTAAFHDTLRRWIEEWERFAEPLCTLLGSDDVAQAQAERRATLAALDDGLLRRSLVVAVRG